MILDNIILKFINNIRRVTGHSPDILNIPTGCFALFDGVPRAEPPRVTQQLPTKQPRRKTGVTQARRNARKRRNRK